MSAPAPVTTATLEAFSAAWNAHDIDALMSFMSDDCVFQTAAGPEACGTRVVGTDAADGAVITGDDGAFELDVPAGAHRLEVRLDGFETSEVSVPATASATSTRSAC